MVECNYYKLENVRIQRQPISRDRQRRSPAGSRVPWCSHPKHSPADREIATGTIASGGRLQCEGMFAQCPLTDEQFDDV